MKTSIPALFAAILGLGLTLGVFVASAPPTQASARQRPQLAAPPVLLPVIVVRPARQGVASTGQPVLLPTIVVRPGSSTRTLPVYSGAMMAARG